MGEPKPPRFCPNCGAQNPMSLPACATCGQPLVKRDDHSRLWGAPPESAPDDDESNIIDLYPTTEPSSSTTTPSDPTVPIEFPGRRGAGGSSVVDRPVDPWSSAGGRLSSTRTGPAPAVVNPVPAKPEQPAPARKGPPGFVLGCLGLLIIAAVAAAFVWTVAEASVSNYVSDEIGGGITEELASIDTVRIRGDGQIVVTADQINAELDRQRDRFAPLSDVRVEITPDGFVAAGSVAGIESRLTGTLAISGGRVVVVDPAVSGPARRLVDADELAQIFERELADLLQRLDLQPTSIDLSEGTLVLQTAATS